jgi:hypothetical protein
VLRRCYNDYKATLAGFHAMDDLTTRLEELLSRYAAAFDQPQDLGEQFRRDLQLLVAEFGYDAVKAALDEIPDAPSGVLH